MQIPPNPRRLAAKVAAIYAIVGTLWIAASDFLVNLLFHGIESITTAQLYKGWFFIAATTVLLFFLVNRYAFALGRSRASLDRLEARFNEIFLQHPLPMYCYDPATQRVVAMNRAAHRYFGIADDFGNLSVAELYPEAADTPGDDAVAPIEFPVLRTFRRGADRAVAGITSHAVPSPSEERFFFDVVLDVTVLERAQQALVHGAEYLRQVLDTQFTYVCVLAADGTLLEANRTMLEAMNLSIEDVRGRSFEDTFWWARQAESRQCMRDSIVKAHAGVVRTEMNATLKRTPFWFDFSLTPIRGADGQVTHIVASGIDITARKALETSLRESEARLRLAAESANIGLWDWNLVTDEVQFSDQWKTMLGYAPSELANHLSTWSALTHPDDLAATLGTARRYVANPVGYHQTEFRMRHKNGEYRWILATASLLKDSGTPPTRMLGAHFDITERKRGEERLRESEYRFRSLVQATSQIVWFADARGRLTEIVGPSEAVEGLRAAAATGASFVSANLHPQDFVDAQGEFRRAREAGGAFAVTARMALRDGQYRYFEFRGVPLKTCDGEVEEWIGTASDVHDRWQAELSLRARVRQQAVAASLGLYALAGGEVEKVLEVAAHAMAEVRAAELTEVWLLDASSATPRLAARYVARDGSELPDITPIEFVSAWVTAYELTLLCDDLQGDPRFAEHDAAGLPWKSAVGVPVSGNRRAAGALTAYSRTPRAFCEDDAHFLQSLANIVAAALNRSRTDQQLTFLANHDALTALPNRSLMRDRVLQSIAQAHRDGTQVALMYVDLDRFKTINDTLGHEQGDLLLRAAAERLRSALREGDTVSRQGGDEYTVLLPHVTRLDAVDAVARKLLSELSAPFALQGREVFVSASIGISLYPADARDVDELVQHADAAMYRAKEQGKNSYQYYTADINTAMQERLDVENALRAALDRKEFRLAYQPQFDISADAVVGLEALLRWKSRDLGEVEPERFIPIAEDTGLIVPIGEWVMRTAFAFAAKLHRNGRRLRVAVNLSARQFTSQPFIETIRSCLSDTGCDPRLIEFEITESSIMRDPQAATETVRAMKRLGARVAIDDFGTGYSSLSHLTRFEVDTLKIDKSFVQKMAHDVASVSIAHAIVALAKTMRLDVVAEGVETKKQLDLLRGAECGLAQGFLLGRPMEGEALHQFVQNSAVSSDASGLGAR